MKWPAAGVTFACVSSRNIVPLAFAMAALAAPAASDTVAPLYAKMKQRFSVSRVGASTGWSFDGALKPVAAGTTFPPQRAVDFVFPRGTRFNLRAVPRCGASDEQIATEGVAVCPARSRVGSGSAGVALGTSGTLDTRLVVLVGKQRLILVFTTTNGSVVRVLSGTVSRNRVKATFPPVVLPDGSEVAVFRLAAKIGRAGTRQHHLITTPSTCPRSGRWTFTYLPRYDPPYGVQRSTSTERCSRS
jgi:hypothetical protein